MMYATHAGFVFFESTIYAASIAIFNSSHDL